MKKVKSPLFSFYDGPPFATGLPHYGHFLAGTIKDVVLRYKTMKGYCVPRRFGWDCHGLPVENEIEKAQNLIGATSIEDFGIANFNEECRKIVLRYTENGKSLSAAWDAGSISLKPIARWIFLLWNLSGGFLNSFMIKDLVYEGFKVMPFSAKLGTPLYPILKQVKIIKMSMILL